MSSSGSVNLSSLSIGPAGAEVEKHREEYSTSVGDHNSYGHGHHKEHGYEGGVGFGWAIVLFIFLVLILWVILIAWRPKFLAKGGKGKRSKTSGFGSGHDFDLDHGRAFLWALVAAVLIIIIFWIVYALLLGLRQGCSDY